MIDIQNTKISKESLWKKRLRGKYGTRVLLVQCLYAISAHSKFLEKFDACDDDEIINSVIENIDVTQESGTAWQIDREYLVETISGICKNQEIIDATIEQFLSSNWSLKRVAKVVQCVLRAATYEISSNDPEAKAFLINDYIEIVKLFSHGGESGFTNGVLDKISSLNIKYVIDSNIE